MSISFVAASATVLSSNPTVTIPNGYAEGDLLILVTTGTATPTTPAGWTQRYAQGANQFITILTKYAGSTESSVSVTLSGTSSRSVMLCYRGAGSYDVVGTAATGTGTTATTNALVTTYANDYILSMYANTPGTTITFTAPGSTTSRVNASNNANQNGLLIVDELQAAAGTSATRAATLSASRSWSAINISFVEDRTLYWVGGTGTWDTTTTGNWANSSGGSGVGILPPVQNEAVIIDGSSGTGTITCTNGTCGNLTVTASQAITLGAASSTLFVFGNLTFPAGGSFSASANANTIGLGAGSAKTITTNGKSFSSLTFNGVNGNWTLDSAVTATGTVTLTNGTITLSTNTTTLTCAVFASSNTNTRSIAFGTGNITTTGSGTAWNVGNVTNFTYSGTPTVNISNNSATATTISAGTTGGALANSLNFNITTGTYALTITTNSDVINLNFTGFTGSWSPGTANCIFYGNLTLVSGMTFTAGTGTWTFAGSSGTQTITSAGKTVGPLTINNTGTSVQLVDNITSNSTLNFTRGTFDLNTQTTSGFTTVSLGICTIINGTLNCTSVDHNTGTLNLSATGPGLIRPTGAYTFSQGTLNLANQTLTVGSFVSTGNNSRSFVFGTGNITTTGSGIVWNATGSNVSYTGTPTINISNNSATATTVTNENNWTVNNVFNFNFTTGTYVLTETEGNVYGSVNFTGFAGTVGNVTRSIFGNWTTPASGITYTTGTLITSFPRTSGTQTITTNGASYNFPFTFGVASTTATYSLADNFTSSGNITLTGGTLNLNNNTLSVARFSSNNANVRTIAFGTGNITTTASGTAWTTSDATNLNVSGSRTVNISNNSGTATTVTVSLTGNTESKSFDFNFTTGTYALTISTGSDFRNINFTGFTGTWSSVSGNNTFFGSITLVSGMTFTPTSGLWTLAGTSGTQTITSAGKTLPSINQSGIGGTVALADTFVSNGTYTLTNGTFNASNQNFTASIFSSNNTNSRTITMGSGTWTLTGTGTVWNCTTNTNLTVNANTSTILLSNNTTTSRTFAGGSRTYNNLTIGGTTSRSSTTITGSNTFVTLSDTKTVGNTIIFTSGTTQSITTLSASGTLGNTVVLRSSTLNSIASLNITNSATINYVSILDLNVFGGTQTVTNGYISYDSIGWTLGTGSYVYDILNSGTSWYIPPNWNSSDNIIHLVGAGGGGGGGRLASTSYGGGGGGGGGYTRLTNQSLSPTALVTYAIGLGGAGGTSGTNGTAGGTTSWQSGTFTAGGGGGGVSLLGTGGTAGVGSTFNGGVGGAGSVTTGGTGAAANGGGGGGGAAGSNGAGAAGGNGFPGGGNSNNIGGGGGGGNGGGTAGANGTSGTGGNGGNNSLGYGGGLGGGTGADATAGTDGGGGGGGDSNDPGAAGGNGIDIIAGLFGSGGGSGGQANDAGIYAAGLYGGGGGGGALSESGTVRAGQAGAQGVIIVAWVATPLNQNYFLMF